MWQVGVLKLGYQKRKLEPLDLLAMMIVIFLYLVLPLLVFVLVVSGYGFMSSIARYIAWRNPRELANALFWLVVAVVVLYLIKRLVKWYKE